MRILDPLAHAQARTRLLDAARTVFAAQGYHAASMNDVAREAGVAKAGLYHYFPGKHALLEALHEDLWADGADRLERAARPRDLRQAFATFGAQYLAYFSEPHRAQLMRIALNISVVEPQLLSQSSGAKMPRLHDALARFFGPCFPKGTRPDAIMLQVTPFIGALFHYQFILRATCPAAQLPAPPQQYLDRLVDIFSAAPATASRPIRPTPAPKRRHRGTR
jgi:AcrR family transcriptional regulator